jgi:hypothetical protein
MMKINKWTLGLAAVGLITIPATMQAEEKMSSVQTLLSSTTISGYVDTSFQWAIGRQIDKGFDNAVGTPPAYAFNTPAKQNGFNLNVVNLVIEKPLDAQDNWAAGYKVDMIFGPNAAGWNSSFESIVRNYDQVENNFDFALKQAYVALRAPVGNGLDFKIGTFDTIIGYETFHSGNNPNFTRSWAYTFEPTEHTGLLATYQICKEFGIAGGVANTWNAGINNRAFMYPSGSDSTTPYDGTATTGKSEVTMTYMAAVTVTAPESFGAMAGSTLYGGIVSGYNNAVGGFATYGDMMAQMMNLYAGMTLNTPVKGLKVGACYDYASAGNNGGADTFSGFWWNSMGGYVSYQATEKLSLHGRGEYTWGNIDSGYGFGRSMMALTGTVQYDLWANVLSRLEFRWDRSLHSGEDPFGVTTNGENGQQNAFMLAANIIYKF